MIEKISVLDGDIGTRHKELVMNAKRVMNTIRPKETCQIETEEMSPGLILATLGLARGTSGVPGITISKLNYSRGNRGTVFYGRNLEKERLGLNTHYLRHGPVQGSSEHNV